MNLKKKKKGFTLIELMAVVAIIAILAAVLVPTVNGYITRSKKTAVISQVNSFITAAETHNATSSTTIDLTSTTIKVSAAITTIGDETLISSTDIDKLGDMTVSQAKAINQDSDAISNIQIGTNGKFSSYN